MTPDQKKQWCKSALIMAHVDEDAGWALGVGGIFAPPLLLPAAALGKLCAGA